MTSDRWQAMDLGGKPRMLVARRTSSKRFDARQAELHADLFDDVREICRAALAELDRRDAKPYAPFAAASSDDYLEIDVSGVPRRVDHRKKTSAPSEPAALLRLIDGVDAQPSLDASDLRTSTPTMYAFVFETLEGYVGFVRNASPRRKLKPGYRFLRFENVLRRIDPPDLAIDDEIDLVVTSSHIAILSQTAFNTLLGDVGVAFTQVPANTKIVIAALGKCLPLTPGSSSALLERCGRRVIDAKRLNHIASERGSALAGLGKSGLMKMLNARGLDGVVKRGKLDIDADSVADFLDAIEGRLFNDDITGEERRADAYSPRIRY